MKWWFLILLFAFASCGRPAVVQNDPLIDLKSIYLSDLSEFEKALEHFHGSLNSDQDLRQVFGSVRIAFKKVEFLMEYTDRETHRLFNGPPVSREDDSSPGFTIIRPQGLQVIDELLCSEPNAESEIEILTLELLLQVRLYRRYINNYSFDVHQYINAIQLYLIRIESLSLAGFDNLCADSGTDELIQSTSVLEKYLKRISGDDHESVKQMELLNEMFSGKGGLEVIDYTRLIRDYIQPLRESLAKISSSGFSMPQSIDLNSISLYDPNFIDATYFSPHGIVTEMAASKIELGRKLFQDPVLSATGTMSCASCHDPQNFFTDGLKVSTSSIEGTSQLRNTPSLIHGAFQSLYMYDGRAKSLEDQMLHVFRNRLEFQSHISEVVDRLTEDEFYYASFSAIYPEMAEHPVNQHSLTDAIGAYMRSLTSNNSPFDRFMRRETGELPNDVIEGFNLFMKKGKCGTCHFPPVFSGLAPPFYTESEMENIGVPGMDDRHQWQVDEDLGRWYFYNHKAFRHFFKTPTLRNSELTGPYMHNGIFSSLDDVMAFYNNGGGAGAGLDYPNQSLSADPLGLTDAEQQKIIRFLESLTDPRYLVNR